MKNVWLFNGRDELAEYQVRQDLLRIPEVGIYIKQAQKIVDHTAMSELDLFTLLQSEKNPFLVHEPLAHTLLLAVQVGLFERFSRKVGGPDVIMPQGDSFFASLVCSGAIGFDWAVELNLELRSIPSYLPKGLVVEIQYKSKKELKEIMSLSESWGIELVGSNSSRVWISVIEEEGRQFEEVLMENGFDFSQYSQAISLRSEVARRERENYLKRIDFLKWENLKIPILNEKKMSLMTSPSQVRGYIKNDFFAKNREFERNTYPEKNNFDSIKNLVWGTCGSDHDLVDNDFQLKEILNQANQITA